MRDLEFRYANGADTGVIHALIERAYRGPDTAGRWDSESHILKGPRTAPAFVAACILDENSRFVMAERGDLLVGCALVQSYVRKENASYEISRDSAYFGMFAIDPDIRGGGVGDAVLAECEARVRDLWAVSGMVMTIISIRTELIGWYERRGYLATGARLPFPFSETTGEVRRDFDLVELRKEF